MLKAIKEACDIILENTDGKPILFADYMSDTTLEFSMESVYAQKKGVNVIRWDGQRNGTLRTTMSVYNPKWIALLFGTEFKSDSVNITKREVIDVAAGGATSEALKATPIAGSMFVYRLDDDLSSHIEEFEADTNTSPTSKKYYYDTSTKLLKFNSGDFPSKGKVVVYYLINSIADTFTVTTTDFPAGYRMRMNAKMRGTDQKDSYFQIYLPNIKPQSNMTLTMSDDNVGTIDIVWDIMGDSSGHIMEMTEIV